MDISQNDFLVNFPSRLSLLIHIINACRPSKSFNFDSMHANFGHVIKTKVTKNSMLSFRVILGILRRLCLFPENEIES